MSDDIKSKEGRQIDKAYYLHKIEQRTGYVDCELPTSPFYDELGDSGDAQWELRIPLHPDAKNINAAIEAASSVLFTENGSAEDLYFKFFVFNKEGQTSFKDIGLEGCYGGFKAASDRDSRSKECCLYMRQGFYDNVLLAPAGHIINKDSITNELSESGSNRVDSSV